MPCSRSPGGVCYPSMHCSRYPSMPCSRSPGGCIPACIAGGIPACLAAGLQGVCVCAWSGGCTWSGVYLVWGPALGGLLVWWPSGSKWPSGLVPSGLVAFWFGGLLVESGLLVWWPSGLVAFWFGGLLVESSLLI